MTIKYVALAAFSSVALSGCATVMNGTNVDMDYRSDPDGAVVAISNGMTCTTPCTFEVKRGHDQRVTFERDGYEPVTVYVQSRLAGSTFGNIIAGGGIGAVVDGSNGASNRLFPRPVYVRMVATGSSDEPVILDAEGEVIMTVAEHNAAVEADVLKGLEEQGLTPVSGNYD